MSGSRAWLATYFHSLLTQKSALEQKLGTAIMQEVKFFNILENFIFNNRGDKWQKLLD